MELPIMMMIIIIIIISLWKSSIPSDMSGIGPIERNRELLWAVGLEIGAVIFGVFLPRA